MTAVSSRYVHCLLNFVQQEFTPYAEVVCYNNSGVPVNSPFTVQWVTR